MHRVAGARVRVPVDRAPHPRVRGPMGRVLGAGVRVPMGKAPCPRFGFLGVLDLQLGLGFLLVGVSGAKQAGRWLN